MQAGSGGEVPLVSGCGIFLQLDSDDVALVY